MMTPDDRRGKILPGVEQKTGTEAGADFNNPPRAVFEQHRKVDARVVASVVASKERIVVIETVNSFLLGSKRPETMVNRKLLKSSLHSGQIDIYPRGRGAEVRSRTALVTCGSEGSVTGE